MVQEKVGVFVGCANGTGWEIIMEHANEEYRIAFMDIDKESGNLLKKEIDEKTGGNSFFFHGDINSEEDRELFAGAVSALYTGIDCLYFRSDIKNGRDHGETGIEELLKGMMKRGSVVKDYIYS